MLFARDMENVNAQNLLYSPDTQPSVLCCSLHSRTTVCVTFFSSHLDIAK